MTNRELLWTPSPEQIGEATLTMYGNWLVSRGDVPTPDYRTVWEWSTTEIEAFWQSIVDYFDVRFDAAPSAVLTGRTMPGTHWFPGAELSYAEHIFRGRDDDVLALQSASEIRRLEKWTWGRLRSETAQIAAALKAQGIGKGDRVAAYMPNIPETVAAFLACASLGATWSSAAPEFGASGVVDRFAQIEPKLLITVDGYRYGGRDFDRRPVAAQIAACLGSSVTHVTFGYLDGSCWPTEFVQPCRRFQTSHSRRCHLTTHCGCCTALEQPGCRKRLSTDTAACCWSS